MEGSLRTETFVFPVIQGERLILDELMDATN